MEVDGPRADRAAAGRRDARAPVAREQRPEHEERGAHRLHEVVRRLGERRRRAARPRRRGRRGSARRAAPRCRSTASRGADVDERRDVRGCTHRSGVSRVAKSSGSAAFFDPLTAHLAAEARAALDHDRVHAPPSAHVRPARGRQHALDTGRIAHDLRSSRSRPSRATQRAHRRRLPGAHLAARASRPATSTRAASATSVAEHVEPVGPAVERRARLAVAHLGRAAPRARPRRSTAGSTTTRSKRVAAERREPGRRDTSRTRRRRARATFRARHGERASADASLAPRPRAAGQLARRAPSRSRRCRCRRRATRRAAGRRARERRLDDELGLRPRDQHARGRPRTAATRTRARRSRTRPARAPPRRATSAAKRVAAASASGCAPPR